MIHAPATLRSLVVAPGGEAEPWRITRQSGPDPAQALVGRTAEEAARLVPLVFNLCGAAHAAAAYAALGLPHAPDPRAMARETARDHALALLHTCPTALGMAPDRATLALFARPGSEAASARALTGTADDVGAFTLSELEAWLAEAPTPTARLFAHLRRMDPALGRARLPELTMAEIAAALRPPAPRSVSPDADTKASAPLAAAAGSSGRNSGAVPRPDGARDASSSLRETGPLGRVEHRPLFAALLAQEGASLFVRLMARLADGLSALAAHAAEGGEGAPSPRAEAAHTSFQRDGQEPDGQERDGPAAAAPFSAAAGTSFTPPGIGIAAAARGLLGHGARVEGGRVASYRILSPSAWTLAPGGLLEQAFAALPPGPDAARLAPLLVAALNPCVPVTLALAPEAAHA